MPMTKKHFEMIAAKIAAKVSAAERSPTLSPVQVNAVRASLRDLADDFALSFSIENPRFDRGSFMTACGF